MSFLAFAPGSFGYFYSLLSGGLLWLYEKGQSKYFLRKFEMPVNFWAQLLAKENDSIYIIQCSYQPLWHGIVYIIENCQAAWKFPSIIFNNLGI